MAGAEERLLARAVVSLTLAVFAFFSPGVALQFLEDSPEWIFVAPLAVAIAALWLSLPTMSATRGTAAHRIGIAGMVVGTLMVVYAAFLGVVVWIVENDTTL